MKKHSVHTASKRGLRRCYYCGYLNGYRKKGCNNTDCQANVNKVKICYVDPIELVSFGSLRPYSVLIKERKTDRNYIEITDITKDELVTRNAICYVETCKIDDIASNISQDNYCKHVKSTETCKKRAKEIKINKYTLYNMNISNEQKDYIWNIYTKNEFCIPVLQRINSSIFSISCEKNTIYPCGRLHITITPDVKLIAIVENSIDLNYYCACKELQVFPHSIKVDEQSICKHAVLLLAGILSTANLQNEFTKFVDNLSFLWKKNEIFNEKLFLTELFVSSTNKTDATSEENIFHNIPRLISGSQNDENSSTDAGTLNLDNTIKLFDYFENNVNLELSDCQIELMDQFNSLINEIDMENEVIELYDSTDGILKLPTHELTPSTLVAKDMIASKNETVQKEKCNTEKPLVPKRLKKNLIATLREQRTTITPPSLEFDNWLAFVIESINSRVDFCNTDSKVLLNFQIQDNFFTHLSDKFSVGDRKRLPNQTQYIKSGKYKGKLKLTWIFNTSAMVKKIFSNHLAEIQIERNFEEKGNGNFEPSSLDNFELNKNNTKKYKVIKPNLHCVYICIGSSSSDGMKNSFIIEWLPKVYPTSQFGILLICFTLGFKRNKN